MANHMPAARDSATQDLYRFYDAQGVLLYIGISLNAAARASQHSKSKPWWPLVARMDVTHHEVDRDGILTIERDAIKAEAPLHNVHHAQGIPAAKALTSWPAYPPVPDLWVWRNGGFALFEGRETIAYTQKAEDGGWLVADGTYPIDMENPRWFRRFDLLEGAKRCGELMANRGPVPLDCCPECNHDLRPAYCAEILWFAQKRGSESISVRYRCNDGHTWKCVWPREVLETPEPREHAVWRISNMASPRVHRKARR